MVACMGTKQMSHSNNLFYFTGYYDIWELRSIESKYEYLL